MRRCAASVPLAGKAAAGAQLGVNTPAKPAAPNMSLQNTWSTVMCFQTHAPLCTPCCGASRPYNIFDLNSPHAPYPYQHLYPLPLPTSTPTNIYPYSLTDLHILSSTCSLSFVSGQPPSPRGNSAPAGEPPPDTQRQSWRGQPDRDQVPQAKAHSQGTRPDHTHTRGPTP